jgi:pimeloyl-ACP methyl ester carboxylesterase
MKQRSLLTVAAACVALLWCGNAFAGAYSKTDQMVTMSDGVQIATTLYEPLGAPPVGGWPAVMMFHGFGMDRTAMNTISEVLWATDDYAALTFDIRGRGQSGGLFDLNGPRTIQDVQELFNWLTARPTINKGLVGAWGVSLGGGTLWKSLAAGVPFAAAEVFESWTNLDTALAPNDLPKSGAIAQLAGEVPLARTAPELTAVAAKALAGPDPAALHTFADSRSLSDDDLRKIKTPTYVFQGRRDFSFGLDQALRTVKLLGGKHGLYIGDFGHAPSTFPGADNAYMFAQSGEWMDLYLKNVIEAVHHFNATTELMPDPAHPTDVPQQYFTGTPPPTTPLKTKTVKVGKTFGTTGKLVTTIPVPQPTKWHETFGSPVVTVSASTTTQARQLVAVVEAVPPKGAATILSEGGTVLPATSKSWTLSFPLISDTSLLKPGTKLRVTLSWTSTAQNAANLLYLTGVPDGSSLTIKTLRVTLPVLKTRVSG